MNIVPYISMYKPLRSLSNFSNKDSLLNIIPTLRSITFTPDFVHINQLLLKNDIYFYSSGRGTLSTVLKNMDGSICSFYTVYLYNSLTGHLLQKTTSDEEGNYIFNNLLYDYKYLMVAIDRFGKNNATILEFTLKEETNE